MGSFSDHESGPNVLCIEMNEDCISTSFVYLNQCATEIEHPNSYLFLRRQYKRVSTGFST